MVRDVTDRLRMFGVKRLSVEKLALTMGQVEEYDPPPNPAKMTDPRAKDYVEKHGASSWEVDALPPDVLSRIIRVRIEELLDREAYDAVVEQEESDKKKMREAMGNL